MSSKSLPDLSIIVTCFNEEQTIESFLLKLDQVLSALPKQVEVVLVDDGSKDLTYEVIKNLMTKFTRVSVVARLFRNSGQGAAMSAAVTLATGLHFAVIDSDLQLDPNDLLRLIAEFDKGFDVVNGYREQRYDPLSRRLASFLSNRVFRLASKTQLKDFGCNLRVLHGELVRSLEFGPYRPFSTIEVLSLAGRYSELPVAHFKRAKGRSGWRLGGLFSAFLDNLVNLSDRPFQYLGVALFASALLFVIRVAFSYVFTFTFLKEVTTGLIINFVIIQALMLLSGVAILGELTIRILRKLQRKPLFVIREVYRRGQFEA